MGTDINSLKDSAEKEIQNSDTTQSNISSQKRFNKNVFVVPSILVLLVGLLFSIFALSGRATIRQNAQVAQVSPAVPSTIPTPGYVNLNVSNDTIEALNPDGTMGPRTWRENWSNTLSSTQTGQLALSISKATESGKTLGVRQKENAQPSRMMVRQPKTIASQSGRPVKNIEKGKKSNAQISAINLTITKAEVHLAYLGTPGQKQPMGTPMVTSVMTPGAKGNSVNHWETLNLQYPVSVTLMEGEPNDLLSVLGITKLAAGHYTQVRLYISEATVQFDDETQAPLVIKGKDGTVKLVQAFTINPGGTTQLDIKFAIQQSVKFIGGEYQLKPVIAHIIDTKK